jgi:hypothetical protein
MTSANGKSVQLLHPAFLRRVALIWIVIAFCAYAIDLWQQTRVGLSDGAERPFGDDFVNYWSAAYLALHGHAAEIYDWFAFHAFQEKLIGAKIQFYHYSYPPLLALITAPLALIPYVPALGVWLVASGYAFYRALKLAVPDRSTALFLALATPALFVNALGGQNGAWSAALLGGGLMLLQPRPVMAGILFGLLAYKPQLGLLLPFALLAGRQWRAFVSAGATVIVLVLASAALFGPEAWLSYFKNASLLRGAVLEDGTGVWHRMMSVFVFARRLGAEVWLAYAAQGVVALIAAFIVLCAWWSDASPAIRYSLLVLGTFLVTPYLQDYDLVVAAFVAAWICSMYPPNEMPRSALGAIALLMLGPLFVSFAGKATGVSFGVPFILPAFVLVAAASFQAGAKFRRET